VVIGGGWIGAEVAASARQQGVEVSIVEHSALPLQRVLGSQVAQVYASIHNDQGVQLITGASVAGFDGTGAVECVRLSDGRTLWADFVVAGVGVTPRIELAEQAGLATDNGVLVSERLETSHRHVYAAGDVANAYHPFYRRRLRVEHWANALNQPATAARAMLGKPASYDRLPYFFSDQYDVGMEYTGYAERWDQVVFRGDPNEREFIAFYLEHERLVAAANVNVWDVADPINSLLRQAGPADVAALRDPDVPLDQLARTGGPETAA
jgi:3-phenylpropionate/trans-cinnamate dioxygenase ferredoxin reductase subunit